MKKQPKIRANRTTFLRNEDGIMAVVFAMMLPVFIVVAALAIDMGYAYWKRNIIQVDASVSALAGAGIAMDDGSIALDGSITYTLIDKDGDGAPDSDDSNDDGVIDGAVILIEALAYAEKTIEGEGILATVDVLPGNWNQDTRTFTSAGIWDPDSQELNSSVRMVYDTVSGTKSTLPDPLTTVLLLNAVMTTTRRASGFTNDNALPLFLASVVGRDDISISTEAIVAYHGGDHVNLDACITALNRTEKESFYINGTAFVWPEGCDIEVYSVDKCAIRAVGIPVVSVVAGDIDLATCGTEGQPECDEGAGIVEVVGGVCDTPNVQWSPEVPINESLDVVDPDYIPFGYLYPPSPPGGGNCGSVASDGSMINTTDYCDLFEEPELAIDPRPLSLTEDGPTGIRPDECGEGGQGATTFGPGNPPDFDYDEDGVLYIGNPGETTVFCGGIDIDGPAGSRVEFAGNIVVSGGEFEIKATVEITSYGYGCTLACPENAGMGVYLMDQARVNLHGSPGGETAGLGLLAQANGPLANFVFFEDQNSSLEGLPGNLAHSLRGTPDGAYAGTIFLQNSTAEMKGTAVSLLGPGPSGGCTVLIADKVYFNGTTEFYAGLTEDCSHDLPPAALGSLELAIYF
jgi:hypothetical protein